MVTASKDSNLIRLDPIDEAMLLVDPPGPATLKLVP
jgi:hypothetical protein